MADFYAARAGTNAGAPLDGFLTALHNRQIYLGLFDTAEEAHVAYCRAASQLFGEFARVS